MKPGFSALRLVSAALFGALLSGCLLKTATVPPHHFILAPIPADEASPAPKDPLSVEIGFVKMPAYLLRDSMAVRNGANEIEYLENAVWAERLDQSFQRALMADLCRSLPSDTIHFANSEGKRQSVRVFITVNQFDVDSRGRGTLVAQWRIAAGGNESLSNGYTRLVRPGVSPRGNPAAIARTMSELTADFSSDLARSLSGSARTTAVSP